MCLGASAPFLNLTLKIMKWQTPETFLEKMVRKMEEPRTQLTLFFIVLCVFLLLVLLFVTTLLELNKLSTEASLSLFVSSFYK